MSDGDEEVIEITDQPDLKGAALVRNLGAVVDLFEAQELLQKLHRLAVVSGLGGYSETQDAGRALKEWDKR